MYSPAMNRKYHDPFEQDCYYHIYNRSIGKQQLFVSEENYKFFLNQWKKYLQDYLSIYAYCLIPNHFHFFAQVKTSNNGVIEEKFKRFFSSYTLSFNNFHIRTGSLFQKGF